MADELRSCRMCGAGFTVNERNYGKVYCNKSCSEKMKRQRAAKKCKQCGKLYPRSSSPTMFCSLECAGESQRLSRARVSAVYQAMRKARARARDDYDPSLDVRGLMEKMWKYGIAIRCYGCGERMTEKLLFLPKNDPRYPTHEHIVPLARGGSHTLENTAISHRRCNIIKGASEPVQADMLALL